MLNGNFLQRIGTVGAIVLRGRHTGESRPARITTLHTDVWSHMYTLALAHNLIAKHTAFRSILQLLSSVVTRL